MQETNSLQPPYPRLFHLARYAAFISGVLLSLLAIYQWMFKVQQAFGQPSIILPSDTWSVAQLQAALAGLGLPAGSFAAVALTLSLLFTLAFLSCGWLILWRRSQDWFGLYLGLILISWAGTLILFNTPQASPWLGIINSYLSWIKWPGFFLLVYFFPNGHVTPRWARWFAAVLGILIVYGLIITILQVEAFSIVIAAPLIVSCLLVGGYSQIYRYRHAGPLEKQQIKWVVLALLFFILYFIMGGIMASLLHIGDPSTSNPSTALAISLLLLVAGYLAYVGIPLSMALAILRYRLWDIDVILRRTLVYTALTLTLGLVFLGSITLLQAAFSAVSGQRSAIATVISTLLIAALVGPLRRRIQRDIDRRFFRQKYNAEQAIERFAAAARSETDIDRLTAELLAVVAETMQPESVSLWLRPPVKRSPGIEP